MLREQRTDLTTELQSLRPTSLFNGPDAGAIVEYAKAAAVLHASEELGKRLQMPVADDSRLVWTVLTMMLHAWMFTVNPGYEVDEDDSIPRIPLTRQLSGQERVFGRVTVKGATRSLTPSAIPTDYTLRVESRDMRLSTRAAIRAEAEARWNTFDGIKTITYDDYLAATSGESNISAYKVKLRADQLYQLDVPAATQATIDQRTKYQAILLGTDPLLLEISQGVAVTPGGENPTAGGANSTNGNQMTQAPQVSTPTGMAANG